MSKENSLAALNPITTTFDPEVNPPAYTEMKFPPLSTNTLSASERLRTRKRSGEFLEHQNPLHLHPPVVPPVVPPASIDMVNKHRSHVEMGPEADEAAHEGEEDVSVDLSFPVPEAKITQCFFDRNNKEWKNAVVIKPFDESITMACLTKMWPFMAGCNMMDLKNGLYLIHFRFLGTSTSFMGTFRSNSSNLLDLENDIHKIHQYRRYGKWKNRDSFLSSFSQLSQIRMSTTNYRLISKITSGFRTFLG
ncbi:2-succinyl-5-enolpyruvyl-6-hydroxy-3-cyclohexene-1-carboxylate synthase [Striga asiatica]|uniref:2-succinyl-5-enolpyruvyl-6-hydroxy-3-cyclohexene-1-carboxylate synthase n=1 Tax=Striga asiatica TaxID=4170 RepID=A0A5A7PKJ9_STRAF|nr:2-succinyl-5-enolpyruvyl-6-hydroxy-3-cyclohexene-1-carboxylate synthase [Striga asiatica]